jgi:23S rRNA pseudouridine1911/1915/1917 synthase
MAFTRHPILGDKKYGAGATTTSSFPQSVKAAIKSLKGQALHASSLGFVHPGTGEWMRFESAVREDFETLLKALRQDAPA